MAVLFVTVKYCEQPLTGEWISKLWYPYSGLLFRFMLTYGGNHHNIVIISQLKIKHFLKKNNHWYVLPDDWISKFISKWMLDQRKWKWYSLSRIWLSATPWTVAHRVSLIHGILQARLLEWVAMPFSRVSSWSRDRTLNSYLAGRFFTIWVTREAPLVKEAQLKNVHAVWSHFIKLQKIQAKL